MLVRYVGGVTFGWVLIVSRGVNQIFMGATAAFHNLRKSGFMAAVSLGGNTILLLFIMRNIKINMRRMTDVSKQNQLEVR